MVHGPSNDAEDPARLGVDDYARPSFKRLPSQTLGPAHSKRAARGGSALSEREGDSDGDDEVESWLGSNGRDRQDGAGALGEFDAGYQKRLNEANARARRMSAPTVSGAGSGPVFAMSMTAGGRDRDGRS